MVTLQQLGLLLLTRQFRFLAGTPQAACKVSGPPVGARRSGISGAYTAACALIWFFMSSKRKRVRPDPMLRNRYASPTLFTTFAFQIRSPAPTTNGLRLLVQMSISIPSRIYETRRLLPGAFKPSHRIWQEPSRWHACVLGTSCKDGFYLGLRIKTVKNCLKRERQTHQP